MSGFTRLPGRGSAERADGVQRTNRKRHAHHAEPPSRYAARTPRGEPTIDTPLQKAERTFVEALALHFEGRGLSPIAGRIVGYLLVCRPSEQSSRQLADALGASKGSISAQTQFLAQAGFVTRTRRRGTRQTFYRITEHVWLDLLRREAEAAAHVRRLADAALEAQREAGVHPNADLVEFRDANAFIEAGIPKLLSDWSTLVQSQDTDSA